MPPGVHRKELNMKVEKLNSSVVKETPVVTADPGCSPVKLKYSTPLQSAKKYK